MLDRPTQARSLTLNGELLGYNLKRKAFIIIRPLARCHPSSRHVSRVGSLDGRGAQSRVRPSYRGDTPTRADGVQCGVGAAAAGQHTRQDACRLDQAAGAQPPEARLPQAAASGLRGRRSRRATVDRRPALARRAGRARRTACAAAGGHSRLRAGAACRLGAAPFAHDARAVRGVERALAADLPRVGCAACAQVQPRRPPPHVPCTEPSSHPPARPASACHLSLAARGRRRRPQRSAR